jgi:hypothetical protein
MPNNNTLACRTMTDLRSCLASKSHAVPTVEFTVLNLDAPLTAEARATLELPELNLFVAGPQTATSGQIPTRSTSYNLTPPTLTFDTPFIMMGLCVYAYGDPYSMVVQGNHFADALGLGALGHLPASPMNLRAILTDTLFTGAHTGIFPQVSPAQIEHGGPIWRALWAFMHAYRLEMTCPSSAYDILMDESLADIGNCCSQAEWQGFGNSGASHIRVTRSVNDRLANFTLPPVSGFPATNGQVVPWNCEQFNDGQIVPEVYTADEAAYGRSFYNAAVEQWYELPCPIPFPSIPQPKLQIKLRKVDGDQPYTARMLDELTANYDLNPTVSGGSTRFPLNDGPVAGPLEGYGGMTRIPSGQFRIGIGIKGFLVRGSVCDELSSILSGHGQLNPGQLCDDPRLQGLIGSGGVVQGAYQGPSVACGPIGTR